MAIKLSQSLKQTQNLMMTPQLQQAIKLLTLTHLEMTTAIAEEMVENPLLEEVDEGPSKEDQEERKTEEEYQLENLEAQNREENIDYLEQTPLKGKDDFDWEGYMETYNSNTYTPPNMATSDPDDEFNYENIISRSQSLPEHLLWQLRMDEMSESEWKLAEAIIHNLNDDGYLSLPFDELIAASPLSREDAFLVLEKVQSLDPVGCGAQDLTDCLLAQARIAEERSPLLERIIKNHLNDLQVKDYEKIAKVTGASITAIKDAAMILHQFNPKPGRLVSNQETHYVIPDVYVVELGGEFVLRVNDDGVPHLRISKTYQEMLKSLGKNADPKIKEYVQDKVRAAAWLIKSIKNRQSTIMKVSKAVVAKQQEFFKKGAAFLKPMVLKDIADEIGMHESTVSRVTTNKFMHTPRGIYELKYFFSTAVGGKDGGSDVSSEVLKIKIKQLLDNENAARPLPDQKIVEILKREGINVARRTIAKYREELGIMSSAKRKKVKNAKD